MRMSVEFAPAVLGLRGGGCRGEGRRLRLQMYGSQLCTRPVAESLKITANRGGFFSSSMALQEHFNNQVLITVTALSYKVVYKKYSSDRKNSNLRF